MRELELLLLGPVQQILLAEPAPGNAGMFPVQGLTDVLVKYYADVNRTLLTVEADSIRTAFRIQGTHWFSSMGESISGDYNFHQASKYNNGAHIAIPPGVEKIAFWDVNELRLFWIEAWGCCMPMYRGTTKCGA